MDGYVKKIKQDAQMEIVYIATEAQTFKWQKTFLLLGFILMCIPWILSLFYQLKFQKRVSRHPLFYSVRALKNAMSFVASLQ